MRGCRVGCLHRAMVQEYYLAREAWELEVEAASGGYETEAAEYRERHDGGVTFKTWLESGGWEAFKIPEDPG